MISQLQTRTDSYGSESAPCVLAIWMKERMEAVEGKIQEPGSERFATIGPSTVVQVLPSCLGEPVAVSQGFPADPLLLQLPPLLPACPFSIDRGSSNRVFMRLRLPTLLMLPADRCLVKSYGEGCDDLIRESNAVAPKNCIYTAGGGSQAPSSALPSPWGSEVIVCSFPEFPTGVRKPSNWPLDQSISEFLDWDQGRPSTRS